ncbi:sensor histidine kinase [Cellulomonas fengjieae]|uniref:histidine kinase n=1 Tax=Cellulomonas fengjieae TaxID=2819978 RepID=A0ABS3SEP8_9CELL|nr:ATP-binding protein [Cellulomonas fengjieae]MBO3084233.1 HAMP domain-containing protein [Cellulomonas fengjieae]MBO3103547.1 HAMP domain-containing protein [Cellulomonas fengjieae]QVI64526.1 HAMP domain-containing protein [Cellulomonas fengjieae]
MTRSLSVRWRLTIAYTVIVALSGAVLLTLVYGLVTGGEVRSGSVTTEMTPGADDDGPPPVPPELRDDERTHGSGELLQSSWLALAFVTVVSVGIGWVVAGRLLAPVHTITARAQRISADSLDERIALGGPRDELRALADTFDALLGRVQTTVTSERRLVATMSHELRTPLANQQAALDVALADPKAGPDELRAAATTALDQSRRAARTIDALLLLTRAQSGEATGLPSPVDLRATVAEVVEQVRSPDDGLAWEVDLAPATVPGEPDLLARAAANLVDNAAHHNVPHGRVVVRLTVEEGVARMVVENTGPLVAPGAAEDLVLPFRRGSADRTAGGGGVGLGLTVVSAVAEHHGGQLLLKPRPDGGLVAELLLPTP